MGSIVIGKHQDCMSENLFKFSCENDKGFFKVYPSVPVERDDSEQRLEKN